MKLHFTLFFILTSFCGFGQQIFKENFSYPDNSLLTANGWTAHSGTGVNAIKASAGLTYAGLTSAGGAASLTTSGEDISKTTTKEINSGTAYASLLVNISAVQEAGDYFFHLGPTNLGTTFRAKIFVKKSGTGFQVGITKASNAPNYSTTTYELNKTHLLVLKYTFKTSSTTDDELVLFVNPTLDAEPATAVSTTPTGETDAENFGTVALRQGTTANAPTLKVDEILVGTAWRDVVSTSDAPSVNLKNIPQSVSKIVNKSSNSVKIGLDINNLTEDLEILAEDGKTFQLSKNDAQWDSVLVVRTSNAPLIESFYLRISEKLNSPQAGKQNLIVRSITSKKVLASYSINYQITDDASGISTIALIKTLADQTTVKTAGRVTSAGEINNLLYVQDATGGIPVSGSFTGIKIGDSVTVAGKLGNLSKQLYIQNAQIQKITANSVIYSPKNISLTQLSANEGNLISVQNISFSDKSFVFLPNSNYTITDGSTNAIVRVWDGTDIDGRTKPQGNITLTGVVGRFNDTYQIYPRSQADVPTIANLPNLTASVPLDKTLDVVSWNVEWFGNAGNGPSDEALQQANVKRVLDSLRADLYVLAEISNPTTFDNLLKNMPAYKGVCSSAFSAGATATDAQRVCFVYKNPELNLISTKVLLKNTATIANYPDTFDRFWASGRLPFMGVFETAIDGVKRTIHVVGIHARANTGSDTPTRERIFQQRKIDVEVLKDSLDKYHANDLIILAGDYNDDLDENVVAGISTKESSYKKFVDDTQNWLPITKSLSEKGFRSYLTEANVIDHIITSNELKNSYLANSETLALPFTFIPNYVNTTSDHLPTLVRFKLEALPLANEELPSAKTFVFPNPTQGEFELNISETLQHQEAIYTLVSSTGKIEFSEKGTWTFIKSNLSSILKEKSAGSYFLHINSDSRKQIFKILLTK